MRLLEHGALLRLNSGHTGLLHRSQLSWLNKRAKVDQQLNLGDEIDVVVTEVKQSNKSGRLFISLSRLPKENNPWETVLDNHPVGSRNQGTIVEFLQFGAIVEFPSGFQALIHDSETSWTEKKSKARDAFRMGDVVEVIIQKVDIEKRKIYASYRLAVENPWETLLHHFPIGTKTTAEVVSIKAFGVIAKLSNGCTGLLHQSNHAPEMPAVSPGDSLEIVIDSYDQEEQRIAFRCPSA